VRRAKLAIELGEVPAGNDRLSQRSHVAHGKTAEALASGMPDFAAAAARHRGAEEDDFVLTPYFVPLILSCTVSPSAHRVPAPRR